MHDDVGFGGFGGDEVGGVEIAVDETDFGEGGGDFGTAGCVTHEDCVVVFRVFGVEIVEDVAAWVRWLACSCLMAARE